MRTDIKGVPPVPLNLVEHGKEAAFVGLLHLLWVKSYCLKGKKNTGSLAVLLLLHHIWGPFLLSSATEFFQVKNDYKHMK